MSTILDSLKKSSHSRSDNDKAFIESFNFFENNNTKKSHTLIFILLFLLTGVIVYFGYQYLYPSSADIESIPNENNQISKEINDDIIQTPASLATDVRTKPNTKIQKPDSGKVKKILQNEASKNQKLSKNNSIGQIKPTRTAIPSTNLKSLNKPLKNIISRQTNIRGQLKQLKSNETNPQSNANTQYKTIHNYKLAYQLPFIIRKDLPELILNIHVYDENPNNRIAIINGEKFAVNALIDEEILVKEIVLEGVVLEFKNEIFLLPKL